MDLQTLPLPIALGVGMIGVTLSLDRLQQKLESASSLSLEDLFATIQTLAFSPILASLLERYKVSPRDAIEFLSLPETQQSISNIRSIFDQYYELKRENDRSLDSLTSCTKASLFGGVALIISGLISPFLDSISNAIVLLAVFAVMSAIVAGYFLKFKDRKRKFTEDQLKLRNQYVKAV